MESSNQILTLVEERLNIMKDGSGGLVYSTNFKILVGSLWYLTATQPDIVHGVGIVSRFIETPRQSHLQAARHILRYVKGMKNDGIFYSCANKMELVGYIDNDWAGDIEKRKSTLGYVFHFSSSVFSSS